MSTAVHAFAVVVNFTNVFTIVSRLKGSASGGSTVFEQLTNSPKFEGYNQAWVRLNFSVQVENGLDFTRAE
jgi:hypothetical protein